MHFELKHVFDSPVETVLEAMFDAELPAFLKAHMKQIQDIKPVERVEEGGVVRRRTRYVPTPMIKKVGPKEVPPEALAFVEESKFDRAARRIEFKNIAEHERVRKHLENGGNIVFRDMGNGKTERTVQGELKITNLPWILKPLGGIAESIIYSNAQKLLDEEAKVFGEYLKQRKPAA